MAGVTRFRKCLTAGLGACSAIIVYYGFRHKEKAYASSTTNYIPSCEKWDTNWDRREPKAIVRPSKGSSDDNRYNEEIEKRRPKCTRNIILIRHGQYNMNGKIDSERVLTELGRRQALLTGERLKELNMPYTQLISSTLTRAKESATLIAKFLPEVPIANCPLLEEGAPIPPDPPIGNWKPENYFYQDGPRIEAAFRKYFHRASCDQKEDSYQIIVCHANIIRYFVCRALQFPGEAWLRMSLNHASITWLSIMSSGRVTMRVYGDSGHMPPNAITNS